MIMRLRKSTICAASVFLTSSILFFICGPALANTKGQVQSPDNKPFLVFGFLPMESPVSLFKRFAPLRDYLSTQIEKEIRLETAKDFPSFINRTKERFYDIVFTAPHMALHALDGDSYEAAATFIKPLKSVVVVKQKSAIQGIADLESKTIATPPDQAIVTMVGMEFMHSEGINAARYATYRTHNAAYSAVLGGEVDAAIVSNFIAMKAISKNMPLKIVASSEAFPGIGILIARDLPEDLKSHIKKAIWGMKELPHGEKILKIIAQPGYKQTSKKQFEVLRPFVKSVLQ